MSDDVQPGIDRRRFLTVLGVTGAGAAAVSGCSTQRIEKLVPYLVQSEDQVPGIPTWYASTCGECSAGCGLHVKTREGRAIKLEGNPDHPVNAGTLCSMGQSSLQALYNPGRLRGPMARNASGGFDPVSWDDALKRLSAEVGKAGGRVALLTGADDGSFTDLAGEWTRALGGRLVRYQPFAHEPVRAANRLTFGLDELPAHDFARAKYILSFGADFLESWLSPVENQRGYSSSHGSGLAIMAKHVSFDPRMSLTGLNADEFYLVKPGTEAAVVLAMANVILSERSGAPADANGLRSMLAQHTPEQAQTETGVSAEVIKRVAREFASAEPGLAVAGGIGSQHRGAIELCAAVNLLNYVAGNVGRTVLFGARLASSDGYGAMTDLMAAMDAGQVGLLLVHESNPVYTVPNSAALGDKLKKVPFKVSFSMFLDETSKHCDLLLPNHHFLERWGDHRPRAGLYGLMQPVMEPVFGHKPDEAGTKDTGDVLLQVAKQAGGALSGLTAPSFEAWLRQAWTALAKQQGAADAEAFWRDALQRGGLFLPPPAPPTVRLAPGASQVSYTAPAFDGDGEFVLVAYPTVLGDGRGANRPWLRELPDPVTRITWHSWAELHPDTAARMDVRAGEILRITSPHGVIEAPAWLHPGLDPGVVAVPLGLGHSEYGEYAAGVGTTPLFLLDAKDGQGFLPYVSTRVTVEKTGGWKALASTAGSTRQLGRGVASAMPADAVGKGLTIDQYLRGEESVLAERAAEVHTLYGENPEREIPALKGFAESQHEHTKHGDYARANPQWGMVIDLAKCTGCSACVTACYAENNLPTVGESDVIRGREMSWMRIERYYEGGTGGEPFSMRVIPMLCQQCGNAPCEPVCPVYAAYHTADGLNGQVYNRCVGTRYCSNNCPFKVRYFNWFAYGLRAFPEPLNLQLNPDVTVRPRGVMEKCTFCVQRIRHAQHQAKMEDRELRDGEIITACAQACPSNAIVFGDRMDPDSRVSKAAQSPRGYHVLEALNVRPSITYLAKVIKRSEA